VPAGQYEGSFGDVLDGLHASVADNVGQLARCPDQFF
jgi:hypothetical protein